MGRCSSVARDVYIAAGMAGLCLVCTAAQGAPALALFRAASCDVLDGEYTAALNANREIIAEIQRPDQGTFSTNAAGVATLAATGAGASNGQDNGEMATVQAELAAYQRAIVTVAVEKKCALPASGPGLDRPPR